jgi:hypothetical protein
MYLALLKTGSQACFMLRWYSLLHVHHHSLNICNNSRDHSL